MRNRRMEFFIGMMALGIVAGVFIMTILFASEQGLFIGRGGRRMTISFERAAGIGQNSVVMKNGIKIGRVYSVDLVDEKDKAEVRVAFELDPEAKIYSNEYAKINRTILGDASIEFVKNPDFKGEVAELGSDAAIIGVSGGDLMGTVSNIEGDLAKAIQNVNQAAQGLTLFMGNLNAFLGDEEELKQKKERLQAVFTELNDALVSINSLATHMDSIVADEKLNADIRAAVDKAPQILERVDELMTSANSLTGEVRQTMDRAETTFDLLDKNLDNVNVFTTALAEDGPEAMTALNETAVQIREMSRNIGALAAKLTVEAGNPDTPLGMLADKETAESLRRIVRNAEELTEKVYPIIDDARVFSNKIAHRPSSLIWDRNTFKGAPEPTGGRYGMQSKSPSGGVSSPLYRQTPSGAKICQRADKVYRYEPRADVDFMDVETQIRYENAFPNETAKRGRWSLSGFWNKIFAKNDKGVFPEYSSNGTAAVYVGAPRSAIYSATFAAPTANGANGGGTGSFVGNAAYSDFGGSVDFGLAADSGTLPSANVPAARPLTAAPSGLSERFDLSTDPDSEPIGPYSDGADSNAVPRVEPAPTAPDFGGNSGNFGAAPTAIEELPSAVVRGAAVSRAGGTPANALTAAPVGGAVNAPVANGEFEDDGMPMLFAPPTNGR